MRKRVLSAKFAVGQLLKNHILSSLKRRVRRSPFSGPLIKSQNRRVWHRSMRPQGVARGAPSRKKLDRISSAPRSERLHISPIPITLALF